MKAKKLHPLRRLPRWFVYADLRQHGGVFYFLHTAWSWAMLTLVNDFNSSDVDCREAQKCFFDSLSRQPCPLCSKDYV